MVADFPRVNGNQFSWSSITIKVGGEIFYGITAANYTEKRERASAYGQGRAYVPRGVTGGKYSAEGSIEIYSDSATHLKEFLALQSASNSYGDKEFDVNIQYVEFGTEESKMVEMIGCYIVGVDVALSESNEPIKEKFDLYVKYIRSNGLTLFAFDPTL